MKNKKNNDEGKNKKSNPSKPKTGASSNKNSNQGAPACLDAELFGLESEMPRTVAICGCGRSKSLPYCDGSHECHKSL